MRPSLFPVLFSGAWTPLSLGASLIAWWDAEATGTVTESGGAVSDWATVKGGSTVSQATAGFKPVYSATSFNSRPGITFDGIDDYLTVENIDSLPSGALGCEMWAACDQTVLAAVATQRGIAVYGGASTFLRRGIFRATDAVTNHFRTEGGDGAAATGASEEGTVDFSGRHVVRGTFTPTTVTAVIDGVSATPAALVPGTGTTRTRIGSNTGNTPGGFFGGVINTVLVTGPLSDAQAIQMRKYLNARAGLA